MKVCEKGTFFSTKGIRNGYLFRQNGLQKSKEWGLGGGGGNFVEYPPEPTSSKSIIKNHSFSYKLLIRTVQSLAYPHSLLSESHSYKRVHVRNVIYVEVSASRLYTRATQRNNAEEL